MRRAIKSSSGHTVSLLAVIVVLVLECSTGGEAETNFNVSLELQGGNCLDQLTVICRHSAVITPPNWIHNGTVNRLAGDTLGTAFPGSDYTVESLTEHRAIISGVDSVQALDGHFIQCVYDVLGTIVKSNAVQFSFIPDYKPTLSLVSFRANFSERLSTFTYSYKESCSLYPRCTPYFSVEHTVSPLSVVSTTSRECTVEYTISNLTRCTRYESTGTVMFGNRQGNTIVVGDSVMLSPGHCNITMAIITNEANSSCINVAYDQIEPDCPGYPTERYTVDIDGMQVANMTADEFHSKITNHSNGFATLSLPLTQRLSEVAVTLNMTKFNTVPTNMSDDMGNIVTENVTWGTSAVFRLQEPIEPTIFTFGVEYNFGAAVGGTFGGVFFFFSSGSTVIIVICICKKKKSDTWEWCFSLSAQSKSKAIAPTDTSADDCDLAPAPADETLVDVGRSLPIPPDDSKREEAESGVVQPLQQYAELQFADRETRPIAAPPNENFDVKYAKVHTA